MWEKLDLSYIYSQLSLCLKLALGGSAHGPVFGMGERADLADDDVDQAVQEPGVDG
jgi:hypothetical protein